VRKLFLVSAALGWFSSAQLTEATILLNEPFSYTDGALVTVSSGAWVHHSGTVTGEVKVVSGKALLSQTNAEDVGAILLGQPYPPSTNISLYASFILRTVALPTGASGSYFAHFKAFGSSGFAGKVFTTTNGAGAGFYRVGVANTDNTAASAVINSDLSLNADYVIVLRYTVSNSLSSLWLNPQTESDAAAAASDLPGATNTIAGFALRESFSSPNGMGTLLLDNLVIGTSFNDVIQSLSGPPFINLEPVDQTVLEGSTATFTVAATGAAPLSYQWRFNGVDLNGATQSSLSLAGVTTNQAGPYSVFITNSAGFTNSTVATLTVNPNAAAPTITTQPQSQAVLEGAAVTFSVAAAGTPTLFYQWQRNGTDVPGATGTSISLFSVTTNQAGAYTVTITNAFGFTNSDPAILAVSPNALPALAYLTYNVKGNGATDWTTNAPQVQAIGRELMYLNPDVIAFNEIPNQFTYEMTNFVKAFLPGYFLATNSATDGFIRSAVASRFPILFSRSYLHSADLNPYGYTNSNFTRDLFQAQIAIPGFPQALNVFTTHLKSGQDTDSSTKRGAEASAISNFMATVFLPTNQFQPYLLSGDMNEDIDDPPSSHPQSIQRLVNSATGLRLTTPVNPFTQSNLTFSIQSVNGLSQRYDYIMPSGLLFSNISASQVFRTDLLINPPPPLLTNDDRTASDHLPVLMVFANPYDKPFRLTSVVRNGTSIALTWNSVLGQPYRLEGSSNLGTWKILANNLVATGGVFGFSTNLMDSDQFFRVYRMP